MLARSPASAIAVLKELDARGPFSTLSLAVIIVKDVLVILLFSLNLGLARLSFHRGEDSIVSGIIETLFQINVAAALGVFGAYAQKKIFAVRINRHQNVYQCFSLLLTSALVFHISESFGSEPLLACLILGAVVMNLESNKEAVAFASTLHKIMPTVYLVFFALAGVSVHIETLPSFFLPAFFVYSARLLSLYAGTKIGSKLANCSQEHREIGWMAYVTQAGIAMGLSKSVLLQFSDWGRPFYTFLVSEKRDPFTLFFKDSRQQTFRLMNLLFFLNCKNCNRCALSS